MPPNSTNQPRSGGRILVVGDQSPRPERPQKAPFQWARMGPRSERARWRRMSGARIHGLQHRAWHLRGGQLRAPVRRAMGPSKSMLAGMLTMAPARRRECCGEGGSWVEQVGRRWTAIIVNSATGWRYPKCAQVALLNGESPALWARRNPPAIGLNDVGQVRPWSRGEGFIGGIQVRQVRSASRGWIPLSAAVSRRIAGSVPEDRRGQKG